MRAAAVQLSSTPDLDRNLEAADRLTRDAARDLSIDLVAGSIAERVDGAERGANASVHIGPDGEDRAVYRKVHMFDVEVAGRTYRESEHEAPGDAIVTSELANGER